MPAKRSQAKGATDSNDQFEDVESEGPSQLDQVLAALSGLTAKFVGVETTVSELAARQAALEGAHNTGVAVAAAVLEPELEPETEPETEPEPAAGDGAGEVGAAAKLAQLEQKLAVLTAQASARALDPIGFSLHPYLRPEHHRLRQAGGERVPLELWSAEQYETACPGYSLLNPGARAELEYALVSVARLGDVLDHIECEIGCAESRGGVDGKTWFK